MLKNAIPFTPYYDHEIIKNYGLEFVDKYGKKQIGTAGDANSAIKSFIDRFILNYCDIDPSDENYLFTFLGHLNYNGAQFVHNIGQYGFTNYTLRGENIENVQVIILRSGSTGRDANGHYAAILRINNSYDFVYIEALTNRITWHYIQCIGIKEGEITFNTFPTISPNGLLDYYNGLE